MWEEVTERLSHKMEFNIIFLQRLSELRDPPATVVLYMGAYLLEIVVEGKVWVWKFV